MKLLFDANLSPRLVTALDDIYPGSRHVFDAGLGVDDEAIWLHAQANAFMIVSKDSDFYRFSVMRGFPPKGVIRAGFLALVTAGVHDRQLEGARAEAPDSSSWCHRLGIGVACPSSDANSERVATSMPAPRFRIDDMARRDWPRVRAIYGEGLATGLAAFMTAPPKWTEWDAGALGFGRLVARDDGDQVLGWAALRRVPDS